MRNYLNSNILAKSFRATKYFVIACAFLSCEKFVQIPPPVTQITSSSVFSNNQSAASAMTSVYYLMNSNTTGLTNGINSIGFLTGLESDELTNYSTSPLFSQYYSNTLNSRDNVQFWSEIYNQIHTCNLIIENMAGANGVTPELRKQLTGEAKFMRAFLYFYAANLYGDVPLVVTSDYVINATLSRNKSDDVYAQILMDLHDAISDLPDSYVTPIGNATPQRVRPNRYAALALLSRTYLYTKNWAGADSAATVVISSPNFSLVPNLDSVFLANSQETIWQMQPVSPGYNCLDGSIYVITSAPPAGDVTPASISPNLYNSFESGDKRMASWVGTFEDVVSGEIFHFPWKYKQYVLDPSTPVTEYTMVLRLGEQFLIRAEARAQAGDVAGSQEDLNLIRTRAGLSNTLASDLTSLLFAIQHERQVELFSEWGQRWFDLKRTNTLDSVMNSIAPLKGSSWNAYKALMPIPLTDLQTDPNLLQNSGY